jgi:hypothetical protein
MQVNLKFQPPSDLLQEYFEDRSSVCFIRGPLGSAKTQTSIMKLMVMMAEQTPNSDGVRPTRLFIVRNTYPDLLTTTIRDWQAITRDIAPVKLGHPPSQLLKYRLPDRTLVECDVVFIALDREDHVRKLRGAQGTFAWLNETKELPVAVLSMMDARLGRYPSRALAGIDCDHAGKIIGDTNSPDDDHWYAVKETDTPKGWKFFIQPGAVRQKDGEWVVNPSAENIRNLPPGYYEKLLQGKSEDWIKINLANELGTSTDGKAIWPEFNQFVHVKEFEVHPDEPILYGVDFGLTPAMAMAQEVNGQIRIFDEVVTQNYSAEELAEEAHRRRAVEWPHLKWGHGWGDPAGNQGSQADKKTPFHMLQAARFDIIPAPSNDFGLRRDAVANRLRRLGTNGEPALIIHPRCSVLKKGCAGYYCFRRMRVVGDEKYRDVPDKNMYSHICEALQYLSLGLGDGDLLLGGGGYNGYSNWDEPINNIKRSQRIVNARHR